MARFELRLSDEMLSEWKSCAESSGMTLTAWVISKCATVPEEKNRITAENVKAKAAELAAKAELPTGELPAYRREVAPGALLKRSK